MFPGTVIHRQIGHNNLIQIPILKGMTIIYSCSGLKYFQSLWDQAGVGTITYPYPRTH